MNPLSFFVIVQVRRYCCCYLSVLVFEQSVAEANWPTTIDRLCCESFWGPEVISGPLSHRFAPSHRLCFAINKIEIEVKFFDRRQSVLGIIYSALNNFWHIELILSSANTIAGSFVCNH